MWENSFTLGTSQIPRAHSNILKCLVLPDQQSQNPKSIQFTVTERKENLQMFPFEEAEPEKNEKFGIKIAANLLSVNWLIDYTTNSYSSKCFIM